MDSDAQDRRDHVVPVEAVGPGGERRATVEDDRALQRNVLETERARFGGFKFGSAFFGWLTATGTVVLLTALVAAVGVGVGADAVDAEKNAGTLAVGGAIVVGVILLIAYFAGGYVAGRMARFSGIKQGLAVWLWAVVIAVVVAVISAIAGSQWDVLSKIQGFPMPISSGTATAASILAAVGAALVALIGALLGGIAGMRYHRRVDRVGLAARPRVASGPAD